MMWPWRTSPASLNVPGAAAEQCSPSSSRCMKGFGTTGAWSAKEAGSRPGSNPIPVERRWLHIAGGSNCRPAAMWMPGTVLQALRRALRRALLAGCLAMPSHSQNQNHMQKQSYLEIFLRRISFVGSVLPMFDILLSAEFLQSIGGRRTTPLPKCRGKAGMLKR
jgi:hypothetical protein